MFNPLCHLRYYLRHLIGGGFLGTSFLVAIISLLSKEYDIDNPEIFLFIIVSLIIGVFISFKITKKKFIQEKNESLERTADIYYLTLLYINKLINEKDYVKYSTNCKNYRELNIEEIIELKKEAESKEIEVDYEEYNEDLEEMDFE